MTAKLFPCCAHSTGKGLICVYILIYSIFDNNYSDEANGDTSALAAFRFPVTFRGVNNFTNNVGGGITLLNTRMDAHNAMNFINNTAVFGGGIAMDDRCLVGYLCVNKHMLYIFAIA